MKVYAGHTGPLTPPIGKVCTDFCLVGLAVHQSDEAALF